MNHPDQDELKRKITELETHVKNQNEIIGNLMMEITLLKNDLETIKQEGCWRFVENSYHQHKKSE